MRYRWITLIPARRTDLVRAKKRKKELIRKYNSLFKQIINQRKWDKYEDLA